MIKFLKEFIKKNGISKKRRRNKKNRRKKFDSDFHQKFTELFVLYFFEKVGFNTKSSNEYKGEAKF